MNITDRFLDRILQASETRLTPEILLQIDRCVLDYLGVTFAGRKSLGNKTDEILRHSAHGKCSVIGLDRTTDLYSASMLNGTAAHVLELDDGNRTGAPHLEAVILSALFAIVQEEDLSFPDFARGVLAGYEATVRLSSAIQPSHKQKGFHATGTCGTAGAAMAAGCAMKLNRSQLKGAFSAAASGAAGLLEVLDDNSELKPYNAANAILSGISAAFFGKSGFIGPEDVLGGHRGFLKAFSDQPDTGLLLAESETPAIFRRYVKPYASCRHSHPAVECAMNLLRNGNLRPEEIDHIEVQTYKPAIYGHDRTEITSISAAKMSTPYSVAAAILLGTCGPEAFSEASVQRADLLALAQKVTVTENRELTEACPERRGAIVRITTKDGSLHEDRVDNPLGEPEHPMDDVQLNGKYDALTAYAGIGKDQAEKMKAYIWHPEEHFGDLLCMI